MITQCWFFKRASGTLCRWLQTCRLWLKAWRWVVLQLTIYRIHQQGTDVGTIGIVDFSDAGGAGDVDFSQVFTDYVQTDK